MVIGGGVAGLEAARAAAIRGHKVEIYEKEDRVGGLVNVAGAPDFKAEDRQLIAWYVRQLKMLGVKIECNHEVALDFVLSKSPDAVISATGSVPIIPRINGADHPKAVGFKEAMLGQTPVGNKVVVVGGGLVGCEVALNFTKLGHDVTIVEFLDDILRSGAPTPIMNKMCLKDLFKEYNVDICTGSALTEVNDTGAVIKTAEGLKTIEADTVILAVGLRSREGFAAQLEKYNIEAYSIGDENMVANILHSVAEGYEVGKNI